MKKEDLSSYWSQSDAITPLNLFPIEVEMNHAPINKAVKRAGDNFETIDNPIGDKHNSPIVMTPYAAKNHQ